MGFQPRVRCARRTARSLPWPHPGPAVHLQGLAGHRSPASAPTSCAAPAGRREWQRFQEAEYKFFEHHSTWAQAQRICTWFQAELTSVHSQAELDFLGHNLQKVGTRGSEGCGLGEGRPGGFQPAPALPASPVLAGPGAALVDRPAHLRERRALQVRVLQGGRCERGACVAGRLRIQGGAPEAASTPTDLRQTAALPLAGPVA